MGAWLARHRRSIGILLLVYAILGFGLVAASVAGAVGFARNADEITATFSHQRDVITRAVENGRSSILSAADAMGSVQGALQKPVPVIDQTATLVGQASDAATSLADRLASISLGPIQPLAGAADQFRKLADTGRQTASALQTVSGSLQNMDTRLPELEANLRKMATSMTEINQELANLPLGPGLESQLRLIGLLLAVAAGWFLVQSLLALLFGVALLREREASPGASAGPA
jgi:methyl-accepting chemotaxis protein